MPLTELLPVLRSLDRADKLRAMPFLVQELAKEEEALLTTQAEYNVWSPYDAFDAADALLGIRRLAASSALLGPSK